MREFSVECFVAHLAADGAGLACGVFEHFLELGDEMPKVLGATHFHEVFENGFLQPRPGLQYGRMEVRIDGEAAEMENQITYLYKYELGLCSVTLLTVRAVSRSVEVAAASAACKLSLLHETHC